jgi:hypothetical protein
MLALAPDVAKASRIWLVVNLPGAGLVTLRYRFG